MAESGFKYRILIVDDDPLIRETSQLILARKGYEVRTSADGFAALIELRSALLDLIICDLRMPNMNGFELLSVVRRRFPHIPVIAISGEYIGSGPTGLIADAFMTKGEYRPEQLAGKIEELIQRSPIRAYVPRPDKAPVWTPVNDRGYFVLNCLECLRAFSVPPEPSTDELCETDCPFCSAHVCYLRTL